MNNTKNHNHQFLMDIRETIDQLNRYTNSKFVVSLTSEESEVTTLFKFQITEDDNPIYTSTTVVTNIEIKNASIGTEKVIDLIIDKHFDYRVKEDFFMAAITHFVKCAKEQRELGNTDFIKT